MKLRKLTIHNIASIEDAVIDFESEPLASSEVFLITGKTGAGKSTILDAICLALYANTPRLENTNMQGDTQDGDKSVKIYDPRQLMRRNTGYASVSLTFTGSNGKQYESVWSVARSRSRANGNLQRKNWSLQNLDTGSILTKDDEIRSEIKYAIGLDFSQFCRTTMLAQGEFTRFLNSKDDEKASILEKITGVDIYSKIGRKAYDVTMEKKAVYEEALKLIEGVKILSEEEISAKTAEVASIEEKCGRIKTDRDSDSDKIRWIRHNAELAENVSKAAEALKTAEDVTKSPEFIQQERTVALWNSTIQARRLLNDADRAENEKRKTAESLDSLQDEFKQVFSGLQWHKEQTWKISGEADALKAFLATETHKTEVYADAQTVCGHLSTIISGRKKIAEESRKISMEEMRINVELQGSKEKADKDLEQVTALYKGQKAACDKLEEELASADLPALRRQKDVLQTVISDINMAMDRLKILSMEKERANKTRESLAEMLKAIETCCGKAKELEQPVHDAKLLMDERRRALEVQRSSIDKWAKEMRSALHTGDTCPVCRQAILSELPDEDCLDGLFRHAETDFRESEKTYGNLAEKQNRLNAEIRSLQLHYNKAKKAFEEDRALADAENNAVLACRKCGIESPADNAEELLDAAYKKRTALRTELESKIASAESVESKVKKNRRQAEELRTACEKAKESVTDIEKLLSESMNRIATSQSLILNKKEENSVAENSVRKYIKDGEWKNDWNREPENFMQELKDAACSFNRNTVRLNNLMTSIKESHIIEERIGSDINAVLAAMPEWTLPSGTDRFQIEGLQEKASALRTKVQSLKDRYAAAEKAEKEAAGKLGAFMDGNAAVSVEILRTLDNYAHESIKEMADSMTAAKNAVLSRKTILAQTEEQQKEHIEKKPDFAEQETELFLAGRIAGLDVQSTELQEKKGAINHELRQDADNKVKLKFLISDAEKKKTDYLKWSRMNQLIGDATGNKFRKIAQSYVLSSLIHSANSYMKTLSGRYTLTVEPGTFVISIEDAYQGFVRRAASTISGGESFLVSLSLALALSDIGKQLAVDTLFIDEGFGTLSGEPLQNAVNTLRSLHTKAGRHVGIISHIEELQERIPVQIRVDQEGNNSSSKVTITSV